MPYPVPLASPSAGRLQPAGVGLVVDILELAENCPSPNELLSRATEAVGRAFAARIVVGLLLDATARPVIGDDGPATAGALRTALEHVLPQAEFAVVADAHAAHAVAANDLLERFLPIPIADPCPCAIDAIGDWCVVVAMHSSALSPLEARMAQDALRGLTAGLFARHRLACQRRQRVERVETLSTMLSDIASHLDVDQVLSTIVERARDLVATDAAYLAEVDETTRTVSMRVTTGIADAGYKRGTIALGKGMAGAVAATGRVMVTSDYLGDPRFIHTRDTDANVIREGIHGALVAPLQVGGRILGVLGVANHRPTEFSADDVHLVKSLADGAAIALDNARLYAAQTQIVAQLRELNALTSRQHEALKRSVLIHDQLTELVLQGHGVAVIAERLATLIANPVVVLGHCFNLLAAAGIERAEAAGVSARLEAGRRAPRLARDLTRLPVERRPIHLAPDAALGIAVPVIIAPVMAGSDLLGYVLAIEAREEFDALDFQALEQASTVFALELTRERVVAEVENRLRGDFVHDLVAGTVDHATLVRRAAVLGHDLTMPQVILAVAPDPPRGDRRRPDAQQGERLQRIERSLRTSFQRRSLMAQTSLMGDVIVALIAFPAQVDRDVGPRTLVGEVQADLVAYSGSATVSIGVSRLHRSPSDLARGYREALQALRTGQRLGRRVAVTEFDQLGIERILAQLPDPGELSRYVDGALGSLIAYDAEHGTHLLATLETHLALGCRQRATAAALGIHVNSLQYRLRRMEEIGRLRLADAETRLNLQLALRARRMICALEPSDEEGFAAEGNVAWPRYEPLGTHADEDPG